MKKHQRRCVSVFLVTPDQLVIPSSVCRHSARQHPIKMQTSEHMSY